MSKEQCKAARALLGWTQTDLADRARVTQNTITQFESGATSPRRATLAVIQQAFEAAGIQFTNGNRPGVCLNKPLEQ
ncbi:MAG: helix-turn-helix transcriptional regulator [Myxococcales bacterium]|nr:helix-turn-helix transcriptional regulator [Myxococcales bacterium]